MLYIEEKDYFSLKKLNVFYIDQDIEFQKALAENVDDAITFTMCDSINTALENIESSKYDMILCDISFPYGLLNELFQRFSNEIPIVCISSSNEPKVAYSAARLGAEDYIQKSETNHTRIPKILHNVFLNWIKDKVQKNSIEVLNDLNIRIALKDLINTDLPIHQTINVSLENEIQINDKIKDLYNIHVNEILKKHPYVLKSLTAIGFIQKEFVGQTLSCPNCKSVKIVPHYICDKCKNIRFEKVVIPIHIVCGKINMRSKSGSENKLLCPDCMVYYENTPTQCNNVSGYQCVKCDNTFTSPSITFRCNNCNLKDFDISEGKWVELFNYKLNKQSLNKFKKNIFLLSELEESLTGLGFTVQQYEEIKGIDNTFGPFELVAYRDDKIMIFTILNNDLQNNLRRIFEMDFASKISGEKTIKFAIDFFIPQDVTLRLLEKFGIIPIVEADFKEMINEIKMHL